MRRRHPRTSMRKCSVFRGLVRGGHLQSGDLPAYAEALAAALLERLDFPVLSSTAITMFDDLTACDALYVSAAMHHERACARVPVPWRRSLGGSVCRW